MWGFRVGVSSGIITPPVGVPMAGFLRMDVSHGVHDDLYAKILLVEEADRRVAIITLDILGLNRDEMCILREIVSEETGVEPSDVMIGCTHTHSGPSVKPNPASSLPVRRQKQLIDLWLKNLRLRVREISREASRNLREARVKYGRSLVTGLSYNRRLPIPEGVCSLIMDTGSMRDALRSLYKTWGMPPKLIEERAKPAIPTGTIDPDLTVIRFEGLRGDPIAILTNFSCHPVTLGPANLLISADYPGYFVRFVEEVEGVTVLFTQGASGDVRPYYSERSFREAERIGVALASVTLRMTGMMHPLPSGIDVKVASEALKVQFREMPTPEEAGRMISEKEKSLKEALEEAVKTGDFSEVRRLSDELTILRDIAEEEVSSFPIDEVCELQVMAFGDLVLAAVPGELFTELGLEVKRRAKPRRVVISTLTNGWIGYIITREAYEEGGYESRSALKPGFGELIVDRLVSLIGRV